MAQNGAASDPASTSKSGAASRRDGVPAQRRRSSSARASASSVAQTSVGDNVARIRKARGLTQEALAAKAVVSVDVIARLEQGRKQTARWSTLAKLAGALDVELAVLVSPPSLLTRPLISEESHDGGLLPIRQAITSINELPGFDGFADAEEVPVLDELAREISTGWRAYQDGKFSVVAQLLPGLLADARRATASYHDDEKARAYALLATVYQMAAGVTVMLGHEDLAFIAVERAYAAAREADTELSTAAAAIFMAWILLKQGRYAEAEQLAVQMAQRVEPAFTDATPMRLATFGNLLVNASAAAVRGERSDRAAGLLGVATGAGVRFGVDAVEQWAVFGPRVVAITAVNNAVELADMEEAVRLSVQVPDPRGEVPASWEARYFLNLALAHTELKQNVAAVDALHQSRQRAPEWVTYHPLSGAVVRELLERVPRRTSPRLRELAAHLQVY